MPSREFGKKFLSSALPSIVSSEIITAFAQVAKAGWAKNLEHSFFLDHFGTTGFTPYAVALGESIAFGVVYAALFSRRNRRTR